MVLFFLQAKFITNKYYNKVYFGVLLQDTYKKKRSDYCASFFVFLVIIR